MLGCGSWADPDFIGSQYTTQELHWDNGSKPDITVV